jgi:hypothetical protein
MMFPKGPPNRTAPRFIADMQESRPRSRSDRIEKSGYDKTANPFVRA